MTWPHYEGGRSNEQGQHEYNLSLMAQYVMVKISKYILKGLDGQDNPQKLNFLSSFNY
jgi:hypothetical protein